MKRFLIILVWFPITIVTLFATLSLQNFRYHFSIREEAASSLNKLINGWKAPESYQLYGSLPKVLGASTFSITSEDAVPVFIKDYLIKHHSPMAPYADGLILAARENGLDPLLLLAIAQCESNLGKKMPSGCNNPFGWGIHSQGTLCFANWQTGFDTVAKGLREKYLDHGMDSPEEIMVRYTPLALEKEGSWAKCVNYFLSRFEVGK